MMNTIQYSEYLTGETIVECVTTEVGTTPTIISTYDNLCDEKV